MKKKIIFLGFFLLICLPSSAQTITLGLAPGEVSAPYVENKKTILDTCQLSVQYYMTSVQDTNNIEVKKNNYMILQIGNRMSKFFDYFKMKTDSLGDIYTQQKMDEIEAANKLLKIEEGCLAMNIFKDYPVNKITTYDRIPISGTYRYIDDKIRPNWHFETGDTILLSYRCKKATTFFKGRNYTAWYALEISISDGPWKFWGLPGLILNVSDSKKEYEFNCTAIEKSKWYIPIYVVVRDFYNTNNRQFNKQLKYFYDNPGAAIETSGKIKGLPKKIKSRPYNPIELSE